MKPKIIAGNQRFFRKIAGLYCLKTLKIQSDSKLKQMQDSLWKYVMKCEKWILFAIIFSTFYRYNHWLLINFIVLILVSFGVPSRCYEDELGKMWNYVTHEFIKIFAIWNLTKRIKKNIILFLTFSNHSNWWVTRWKVEGRIF